MNADELSQRTERLESHVSHLERQLETLNEVVIDHGKEILRLRKVIERLTESIEAEQLDRIRSNNTPPPHYGRG